MGAGATLSARISHGRWRGLTRLGPDRLAWIALAGLLVVGAAFLYYETRGTTLWTDEWTWALERRGGGLDTFLKPHNGHFSLIPVALYKLLFATAGLGDHGPYRAMVIAGHLGCVALVFAYVKRRVGSYLALLAAALFLFLGPGWHNILWPFQIAWLLSLAAGLGALLMLDRGDRLGNVGACALLAISLASSGLGLAIALGLAVDVLWGRRRWGHAWIVAAPLAVYALWWIGYEDANYFLRHNIVVAPGFVADAAASAISALAGLTEATGLRPDTPLAWGRPLAVLAVLVLLWRLAATRPVPPRVLTLLTIVLSFWTLTALNRAQISTPFESRYIYVGAFFVLLLAAEVARGTRLPRRAAPLLAAVVAVAIVSNLGVLRDNARFLQGQAQLAKADLAAVEIGRSVARRDLVLTTFPAFPFLVVKVGPYLAAEKAIGSPAATPAELAREPEAARRVADLTLIDIHRIHLLPAARGLRPGPQPGVEAAAGGSVVRRGGCVAFVPAGATTADASHQLDVAVPAAGLVVTAQGGPVTVSVRRFADEFLPVGRLSASASAVLRIGPDLSGRPWHARVAPTDRATVCGVG
ncbi:MAG TPA: hypothetical protein VGN78_10965 [Solirubrobacteraceae bacterium]|jgi:hypothetical protein|nr:hypothetical protein [Solirubrobacteraceae bacterium]